MQILSCPQCGHHVADIVTPTESQITKGLSKTKRAGQVRAARDEQFARFVFDCISIGEEGRVPTAEVTAAYRAWISRTGEPALLGTRTAFGIAIRDSGIAGHAKGGGIPYYTGIRVKSGPAH